LKVEAREPATLEVGTSREATTPLCDETRRPRWRRRRCRMDEGSDVGLKCVFGAGK